MLFKLFLAFTLIPVLEIYLLIQLGSFIGVIPSILIVILTGVVGASLARQQGVQTMLKVQKSMAQGLMPAAELLDAFLILVAGVVLLTPGFITDIAGLLILFPPSRNALKRWFQNKLESSIAQRTSAKDVVIEGEVIDPQPKKPEGPEAKTPS